MLNITRKNWIKYFPHKKVRPEQEIAIDFILNSFINNKKYVVTELPTGLGKSAIAVTLAKYFEKEVTSNIGLQAAYIVTTQKILQEQYKKDFPQLNNISAKTNYFCKNRAIGITCDMGLKIALIQGKYKTYSCHYRTEKTLFDKSQIGLTNLPFFLSHKNLPRDPIQKRKLLVIDECHNMENIVTDFSAISFSKYFIEDKLKIKWPANIRNNNLEYFMNWVRSTYVPALARKSGDIDGLLKFKDDKYLSSDSGLKMMKLADAYKTKFDKIENTLIDADNWVMTTNDTEDTVDIKPIFASNYTENLIFSAADKVIMMSGTILDKKTFCNNNGIPEHEAAFISLDSPFPAENRPIFIINTGKMGRKNIDATLPIMLENVKILLEQHKNEKGIIHTNSYKISNYLQNNIKNDRLLYHSSDDRIDTLQFHKTTTEPTVIVSPSFMEGIDLYGDHSRFQIILKIPFPFLGDNYIRTKMDRVQDWYSWNTIKSLIQSTGRSVRDYDDWAVSYILDGDFNFLLSRNRKFFPLWFTKAIQK